MSGSPAFTNRAIYLASLGKNSYQCLPAGRCINLLQEMAHWGYNEFWFTFDLAQCDDIFDHRAESYAGRAEWEKQKELVGAARNLGMKVTLVSPANVIYRNQADDKEVQAELRGPSSAGSPLPPELGCPSKPRGREVILRNFRNLFGDLTGLSALCLQAYGDGGCRCQRCHPWVRSFVDLASDISDILREYHPDAEVHVLDWRFSDKEVAAFAQYLKVEQPTWVNGIAKSDRYGASRWTEHELPIQYRQTAFLDISKPGGWGTFGANPFPRRTQQMLAELVEHGFNSLTVYSDDLHDDLNKVLAAQFAQQLDASLQDTCRRYAKRHLGDGAEETLYELALLLEAAWTPRGVPWFNQNFVLDPDDDQAVQELVRKAEHTMPAATRSGWRWKALCHRARIGHLVRTLGSREELFEQVKKAARSAEGKRARTDLIQILGKMRRLVGERAARLDELRSEIAEMRDETFGLDDERWPRLDVSSKLFEGRWGQSYPEWRKALLDLECWLDDCANQRDVQAIRARMRSIPKPRPEPKAS